jgi:hypothetical protein
MQGTNVDRVSVERGVNGSIPLADRPAVWVLPLSVAASLVVVTGHQWPVSRAASASKRFAHTARTIVVKKLIRASSRFRIARGNLC